MKPSSASSHWALAEAALAAFSVAPHALGGLWVRSPPGPVRTLFLELAAEWQLNATAKRIPLHVQESRLLGGIELAQTLATGRLHWESGLLAQSDGGVVILSMAERAQRQTVAHLCSALDTGTLKLAREGLNQSVPAAFGVIALDEGLEGEHPQNALTERLGLRVDLGSLSVHDALSSDVDRANLINAQMRWMSVAVPDSLIEALAATTLALGIDSPRALVLTSRLIKILAALEGRTEAIEVDLERAVVMALAHRATRLPEQPPEEADEEPSEPEPQEAQTEPNEQEPKENKDQPTDAPPLEALIEAALAYIPAGLLASLRQGHQPRSKSSGGGKSGTQQRHKQRGRPVGTEPGDPRRGGRLNLMATLRAAAPWQTLRRQQATSARQGQLHIKPSDFRTTRFRHQRESTTLFVVDASGSAAMHRMAEAKGAVELLLADCYSRRDSVALIAFRGNKAELLLPPTRSLVRAKKALAALPGGGGTPLAHAVELTTLLSEQILRDGATPTAVFLTDGVANIARDGTPGRQRAKEEAMTAAKQFKALKSRALVINASPRAQQKARELADALGGQYLAMPQADAKGLRNIVQSAEAIS